MLDVLDNASPATLLTCPATDVLAGHAGQEHPLWSESNSPTLSYPLLLKRINATGIQSPIVLAFINNVTIC